MTEHDPDQHSLAMSPDIKCSLRCSADAHSSALAHVTASAASASCGPPVRLAVFGEGLVAAQSSNALAVSLCEALAISGLSGEVTAIAKPPTLENVSRQCRQVFVSLYCGLSTVSWMGKVSTRSWSSTVSHDSGSKIPWKVTECKT